MKRQMKFNTLYKYYNHSGTAGGENGVENKKRKEERKVRKK